MKTHSNTAHRNAQDPSHPPLARDASGNPLAIPDGAAAWCLKRETGGRPKMIAGVDRQPARFPLDVTADDVEGMVGAGTYRVYAIGADGEVIDYVTTVSVGQPAPAESEPAPTSLGPSRGAGSDLRFALETILQMSRAQSDSLKAVALAQADWVKGLATAKALPRNGYPVAAPPPPYRVLDERESGDDDDDDDDDEDEDDGGELSSAPTMPLVPPWLETINQLTPVLKTCGELAGEFFKRKFSPSTPAVPEGPRNAAPEDLAGGTEPATAPANPMIHLSEINAHLTGFERKFLNVVLRGPQGGELANVLLTMSVEEAASFVKEQIARVQAERDAPAREGAASPASSPPNDAPLVDAPVDAPPADAPPTEVKPVPTASGGSLGFMSHVLAASAYLTAEERATVMWLVPRFPAARLEELKAQLLQMAPRDTAAWIREHLPALRAEVAS